LQSESQQELGKSPFFRPATAGSSVGILKVTNAEEFAQTLQEAFRFGVRQKGRAERVEKQYFHMFLFLESLDATLLLYHSEPGRNH
jgi:hypothetical protein